MAIPKSKTELENYLVYGIDDKNRRIFFGAPLDCGYDDQGDFSQNSVELAVRAIKRMEKDHPDKPIEIHMNSYGGDAYALLYLVDTILSCSCQMKFIGGGSIMSAASWVLAVCDERYLYPNSTIMLHDGWSWIWGKTTDNAILADEDKNLQDKLTKIFVENTYMSKEWWDSMLQRDLYIKAEEALQIGIADFIVQPKKRGNLRKKRTASLIKNKPTEEDMKKLIGDLYKRIKVNVPTEITITLPKDEIDTSLTIDETPIEGKE